MNVYPEDWPGKDDYPRKILILGSDLGLDCRPGKAFKVEMTEGMRLTNIIHELRAEISRLNASFEETMREVGRITKNAAPLMPMVQGATITGQLEDRVEWLKAQLVTMPVLLKKCRDARAGEASAVHDCVQKNIKIEDLKLEAEKLNESLSKTIDECSDLKKRVADRYLINLALKNDLNRMTQERDALRDDIKQRQKDGFEFARRYNELSDRLRDAERLAGIAKHPGLAWAWKTLSSAAIDAASQDQENYRCLHPGKTILPKFKITARVFGVREADAIAICKALGHDPFSGHVYVEMPDFSAMQQQQEVKSK